jgi:signal transduction histidine kinase
MKIRRISHRFALVLVVAALLPLVGYGGWSLVTLRRGTRDSIVAGNLNVATRAAEEIRRYVSSNVEILKALAADLQDTGLETWQQDRILKNYVLRFREFRELSLFDEAGGVVATSRVGKPRAGIPADAPVTFDGVSMSSIRVDDDLLPTSLFAVRLTRLNRPAGWLMGEISLEEMWRMVDGIRIGQHGFALVVDPDGTLIAHGNPDRKALVAQSRKITDNPVIAASQSGPASGEYSDPEDGARLVAVATRIRPLNWAVMVEQPTSEAYASGLELQQQLIVAITAAIAVMIAVGLSMGRRFIAPIFSLQRGTQAIAAGRLETRVKVETADELGELGTSFNTMADRLVELQENVKRQERQAMFGRVVAGLFHDLNHPIQNIGNNARLLLRPDLDLETRQDTQRIIENNLGILRRFMDDILNIAKPRPLERFAVDVNASVTEVVDSMRAQSDSAGVRLVAQYAEGPLIIDGDRFSLGRVYRNLIVNAIQATAAGGSVSVSTMRVGAFAEIHVTDTGSGIPPERLAAIFDDFVTTKRRGLGLGLAISKRIVEQLDGTIAVESEVGRGTSFTLRFPASKDGMAQAQAAAS